MDRLAPLRIFARVAELQSFTKAADSLGVPKASVSAQVAALEADIGARLLQRTTRQVRLTHEGISFYERAKDLLADVDELATTFKSEAAKVTGRVRVDMPSRLARLEIIPKLQDFIALYPNIHVEVGATDRYVDIVREDYDCVIRAGRLPDSSLIARQIGEARIINMVSESYAEKYGVPKSVKDLEKHYLIQYVTSFGERAGGFEYLDGDKLRSVKMRSFVTVNSAESYASACQAGLGIVQSPAPRQRSSLKASRLIEILPKLRIGTVPIHVLYPARRHLPNRVRLFVDWIEKVVGSPRDIRHPADNISARK